MNTRVLMYLAGSVVILTLLFLFMGGDTVITTTTPSLEIATRTVTSSIRFWLLYLASGLILVIWTWVKYDYKNGVSRTERLLNARPPAWSFAVLLGTVTFHWLFWSTKPELWTTWFESTNFWPVNFAVILTVLFLSQKGGLPRLVGLALGLYLVVLGIARVNDSNIDHVSVKPASIQSLSADIVLTTIADCESGDCSPGSARQFENDGVTPLRNREGSSALGMWQIIASTAREKCPDLNIRTLAGNEACARRLYDESGTKHWEADPRSVARWKPKLIALGLLNDNTGFTAKVLKPNEPVEAVMNVGTCMTARGDGSQFDSVATWRGQTKIRTFTTKPGVEKTMIWLRLFPC